METIRIPTLDPSPTIADNDVMATAEKTTDIQALLDRLAGKSLDPETYRRIRERQEGITADLEKKHGKMNIAVDLIREVRDEA